MSYQPLLVFTRKPVASRFTIIFFLRKRFTTLLFSLRVYFMGKRIIPRWITLCPGSLLIPKCSMIVSPKSHSSYSIPS